MSSEKPEIILPHKEAGEYIDVSVAVIEQDRKFLVAKLAPQKPYAGKWEFPGGKIQSGENAEQAVRREIMEELGIEIEIIRSLPPLDYDYHRPDGKLFRLHSFLCRIGEGPLKMEEHEELRWVTLKELSKMDLLESDKSLLTNLNSPKRQ